MLTSMQASGVRPSIDPLVLSIVDAMSDNIQIRNIDGLDPVAAAISSSPQANKRGEAFGGSSVGKRNIVISLGFNPDWSDQTMTSLRQELYKYFMPELAVDLQFISTHLPTCGISGIVEDLRPNMFSEDPVIDVSILCEDPDFVSVDETILTGTTLAGTRVVSIDYEGSQPAGMVVKVDNSVANPSYLNDLTFVAEYFETLTFAVDNVTIDATKYFELSTVPGDKYVRSVTVADPSIYTSLMNKLIGTAEWLLLYPGENELSITATEADLDYEISYFERFGGL